MSTDLAGRKTVDDASRIFLLAIESSIDYCVALGFERSIVQSAIKQVAANLLACRHPAKSRAEAGPGLRVVSPLGTQLRLSLEYRP
jgi:hypothetical protein